MAPKSNERQQISPGNHEIADEFSADHIVDTAIIGGGIAGLYCGYRILKANEIPGGEQQRSFKVFEATKHLDGRIWSTRIDPNGNPKDLSQTAKNPIRLNPYHSSTVFRVNLYDLPPKTTYYYKVDSMDSTGRTDGVTSPIKTFNTE